MDTLDKHVVAFLLLFGCGAVAELQLEPLIATVLRGSNVSFNASVTGPWSIMTWSLETLLALTISKDTGPFLPAPGYAARNISADGTSAWEFSIINVTRSDDGPIICTLQGHTGSTAQLSVQEQGTVDIVSGNLTVDQDEEAEFRCETSDWFPQPEVSWWLGGVAVNGSLYNTTSQAQGTLFNSTSVLRVQAVRDATVLCRAALSAANVSDSVSLVVVPKPTDWTILIAVVVSFGGFALLVLLIIGIIFCCRRKKEKESIQQNERRRGTTERGEAGAPRSHVKINLGFTMDERTSEDHGGETTSADGGFSQRNRPSIYHIPLEVDDQDQTRENGSTEAYNAPEVRKHRHATMV